MINPTHMAQVQPDRPTVSTHHLTSRAKGRRTAKAEPTRTAKTLQSFIVLADILTTRLAMPSLHHLLPAIKAPLRGHEKLTQAHDTRESDERAAAVWTPFCSRMDAESDLVMH